MTPEKILTKVIKQAVNNGFTKYGKFHSVVWGNKNVIMISFDKKTGTCYEEIIFDLDFAKSLWGEASTECDCDGCPGCESYCVTRMTGWEYYLTKMVTQKDRIKYLKKFL